MVAAMEEVRVVAFASWVRLCMKSCFFHFNQSLFLLLSVSFFALSRLTRSGGEVRLVFIFCFTYLKKSRQIFAFHLPQHEALCESHIGE